MTGPDNESTEPGVEATDTSAPEALAQTTEVPAVGNALGAPAAAGSPAAATAALGPSAPPPPYGVIPPGYVPDPYLAPPRPPRVRWINPARRGRVIATAVVAALVLLGVGAGIGRHVGDNRSSYRGPGRVVQGNPYRPGLPGQFGNGARPQRSFPNGPGQFPVRPSGRSTRVPGAPSAPKPTASASPSSS